MDTLERGDRFEKAIGNLITEDFRNYLIDNKFFTLPASLHHHGNYQGGLFDHSYAVMECLVDMTQGMDIKWQDERSPYIVGMFHDLCKIENYKRDIITTEWNKRDIITTEWRYDNRQILPGHGDKSVLLLSQFMTLTEEEVYCIRFHMGPYEAWSREQYGRAIEKYETVLWTHTADMYASRVVGI